jgi:hypothetical protein
MSASTIYPTVLSRKTPSPTNDVPPDLLSAKPPASPQSFEPRVYWGDWFAFKIWVAGFLIMAAMNLVNLIGSLFYR